MLKLVERMVRAVNAGAAREQVMIALLLALMSCRGPMTLGRACVKIIAAETVIMVVSGPFATEMARARSDSFEA